MGATGRAGVCEISGAKSVLVEGRVLMERAPFGESLAVDPNNALVGMTMAGFCRMGSVNVFCGSVDRVMVGFVKAGRPIEGFGKVGSVMVGSVIVLRMRDGFGMTGIVIVGLKKAE